MDQMDVEAGISIGLGITVDSDGDVVILVVVANEEVRLGVPMVPDIARAFAAAILDMSGECQDLQSAVAELSQEQIQERIIAIQQRYAAPSN